MYERKQTYIENKVLPFMTETDCTWETNLSIHPTPLALPVLVLALLVLAVLVLQLLLTSSFVQLREHIRITFDNTQYLIGTLTVA